MKILKNKKFLIVICLFIIVAVSSQFCTTAKKINFTADVKPILNNKCISCHGGVKKQEGFSILFREEMFQPTRSGKQAVVPGHPEQSEMIRRLTLTDPEERMPYQHDPLSQQEIDILSRWIKEGAQWGDHWAYQPVQQVVAPKIKNSWIKNDVDKFIYQKLKEQKLTPSAQADKATMLRRVSLDLIGMYPSKKVISNFLNSNSADAYEVLVDSLLASPHYGERWATPWLDVARYADSKGYEKDVRRNIWPYRDWVIKAFNEDKPYDKFIIEQIAGDLLPNPTDAEYIATAFHRNTMTNDEGGTDNEEFRTAAVIDRVNTTWEGLMGTTFGCVQCHSHPYDPFKHEEYYNFLSYFNNTRDEDVPPDYPLLNLFNDTLSADVTAVVDWVRKNASAEDADDTKLFLKTRQPIIYSTYMDSFANGFLFDNNINFSAKNHARARMKNVVFRDYNYMMVYCNTTAKGGNISFHLDTPDGEIFAKSAIKPINHWQKIPINFSRTISGTHNVYFRYDNDSAKNKSEGIYDNLARIDWFYFGKQLPGKNLAGFEEINNKFNKLVNADVKSVPVLVENPSWMPRKTNVFIRGAWTDKGPEVEAGVPKVFEAAMPADAPKNRIGLSKWLASKKNPLVSRTIINRIWEQIFGTGIVETLEDMGSQGLSPTHQELLDYLSYKLMNEYNWSLKKILKEIVLSATYRQDSKLTEEMKQKDLQNKYYARSSRVRLSGEQIRDQHLCISGAINHKMFGPPVTPWLPEGFLLTPYNGEKWENETGEDNYRRAIYIYIKRSGLYPSLMNFDASARVVCAARRIRTNTPLQALGTLNDEMYFDIARQFAYRMQKEAGSNIEKQIAKGYELMIFKPISSERLKVLVKLYNQALEQYKMNKQKVKDIIAKEKYNQTAEFAALIVVANAMLNLDEAITKN